MNYVVIIIMVLQSLLLWPALGLLGYVAGSCLVHVRHRITMASREETPCVVLFAVLQWDQGPTLQNFDHFNKLLGLIVVVAAFLVGYLVWEILRDIRRRRSIERKVERSRQRQAQRDGNRTEG